MSKTVTMEGELYEYITNSNGKDTVNTLCARDESIKNQLIEDGKVFVFRKMTKKKQELYSFIRYEMPRRSDTAITLRAAGGNYGGGSESILLEEDEKEEYIVRRLTPLECCRLQGFPDGWGEIDHKDDFTEEEYKFWVDVRKTHSQIMGKQVKEWTKEQMLSWYNSLQKDANVYKMWGNGIALPCAMYVLQGIAIELKKQEKENE